MAEQNPLLVEVSRRSGLPEKTVTSDNPLLQEAQQRSGKIITPDSRRHYEFSGLDAAAGQINLTNTYTDPLESYTSYGVPRNAFIDWNDTRAENQTTTEKWVNGLTKAGITAAGAFAENTVGAAAGLLNLAFGENHSYYDNPVGRAIDSANEWAREVLPNYSTKREQQMGVLESMGTANFWADKVANGFGYTLGSLATAWTGVGEGALIAKLGNMGRLSKISKAADKAMDISQDAAKFGSTQFRAYNAAKAVNAPRSANYAANIEKGLASMAKQANINTAAKHLSVGIHMSLAEASVEAREVKNRFIEEQRAKWEEANPGQEMPADVEDGIIESAYAAGNLTFGVNLPILTLTNLISFGKVFKGGKPAAEELTYGIKKSGNQWVEDIADKGVAKAFAKSQRIFGAPLKNTLSEASQEGMQFTTSEASMDYYSDKFSDGVGDMTEAFTKGLTKTFGTKEGLESMVIGALVGGVSGTVNRLAGADSKFAKEKTANTQKALQILNSEGFGKVLENMENSEYNRGLQTDMDKAIEAKDFKKAERLRRRLISSVADQYRKSGALDYAMEQMEDLKQLDEEEFKKRWGYDASKTLKEQTGMSQTELVDDVKSKMERSVKRQEQVQAIVRAQNPQMGMFGRILDSFQSEEIKKSKALENSIRTMYANQLLYRLEHVDTTDDLIKESYQDLIKLAPALSEVSENDFEILVKTGKVKLNEKGEVELSSTTTNTVNDKLAAKIDEVFQNKAILNPEDAIHFDNKVKELRNLITERQSAIQSYEGLRNKPEDLALLVEAEVLKRKNDDAYKNKQQAQASVANSQSVEELDSTFPKNASPEDIAAAMAKREELIAKEEAIMATYEKMSKDEFDAIDVDKLSPAEESAYNRVKTKLEEKEAEKQYQKTIGVSMADPDAAAQASVSYEEVLSDIEARTFGEIMVSPDGSSILIDGKNYYNLEDDPTQAVTRDESGNIVGVTLTDISTGNKITWKVQDVTESANPEMTERENAIVDALTYMTFLQAASIRPDQSVPVSQTMEELEPRIQAAKEDLEVREKFEENNQITETERELAKNNLSKTAGLTDDQLRVQIEVLKQDFQEINEIITAEEQVAREAGFTKKEFDSDPKIKELREIKKKIKQLLTTKIAALRDRKAAKKAEALDTEVKEGAVDVLLSETEDEMLNAGLTEEIKKLEDDLVPLNDAAKGYNDIINGKYGEGQDVAAATVALKEVNKKIGVIKSKITKRKNLINKNNEARELEKLRENRNAAEESGQLTEGQEPEGKDITPREGTPAEGLDGILTPEQVEAIRAQREEAERIRKQEEAARQAAAQGTKTVTVEVAPIVVSPGALDVRLIPGEKERMEGKVLVSEAGQSISADERVQTQGGIPILVNRALSSNPLVAPTGSQVKFEVVEDTDWWKGEVDSIPEEDRWKTVPIYMVVTDAFGNEEKVALLQAHKPSNNPGEQGNIRKEIYDLYKKGLTPVATSAGKIYDSSNYSNARLVNGEVFFYPASSLASNGKIPAIAIVGSKDGEASWRLVTTGNDITLPNLEDTVNATRVEIETDKTKKKTVVLGQVGIVVVDPNGAPRIVIGNTRDMTEAGRTAALAKITAEEPSLGQFAQIVGTNLLLNDSVNPEMQEGVYTELNDEMTQEYTQAAENFMLVETLANGTELITFFSPSANSLVRMNAKNMKAALEGGVPMFSFVEVGKNEKGFNSLVTAKKDNSVREAVQLKLADEFKAAIMNKKFQVSKENLNSTEPYTSPLTGTAYKSYFEYVTSENEVPEARTEGAGTKAILGVDTEVNSQKSPFFDVGIKTTNLGTLEQDTTTAEELAAKQVVALGDNTPTSYAITESPVKGTVASIEREIKEALDRIEDIQNNLLPKVNNRLDNNLSPEINALYEKLRNTKDEDTKRSINNEIDRLERLVLTKNDIIELTTRKESLEGQIESAKKFIEKKKAELAALGQPTQASTQLSSTDKIIWGHPGLGKTTFKERNPDAVLDFDTDFKPKVAALLGLPKDKQNSKGLNDWRTDSNETVFKVAMRQVWKEAVAKAKATGKMLVVSDMMFLRENPQDFDKVITIDKKTFVDRATKRGDTKENLESWKSNIDLAVSTIDQSKVMTTDKFFEDIVPTAQPTVQANQPKVVTVFHHTNISPENFNFDNFQRGKNQISQFGDGLNASSSTNSFFVNRYGNPIQGEVNDSDFIVIDANKSQKETYEMLASKGFKFNNPQMGSATPEGGKYVGGSAASEYDDTTALKNSPGAAMDLFKDFQKSNPNVKGVKVINHIIGKQAVDPFYVIYNAKSFYGPGSLSKPTVTQPQAPAETTEEKVVEVTGPERVDSIFDLFGEPAAEPAVKEVVDPGAGATTGIPSFLKKYEVAESENVSAEDLADLAARYKKEAEEIKNKCKGK